MCWNPDTALVGKYMRGFLFAPGFAPVFFEEDDVLVTATAATWRAKVTCRGACQNEISKNK